MPLSSADARKTSPAATSKASTVHEILLVARSSKPMFTFESEADMALVPGHPSEPISLLVNPCSNRLGNRHTRLVLTLREAQCDGVISLRQLLVQRLRGRSARVRSKGGQ